MTARAMCAATTGNTARAAMTQILVVGGLLTGINVEMTTRVRVPDELKVVTVRTSTTVKDALGRTKATSRLVGPAM
ncbi:hypothetical protein GCM10025859_19610 [Alicyclobacillus fastidiosus]|nr:hypothetical protein GCM10025859_19610 [Alicyclobacillus fastidiosus]